MKTEPIVTFAAMPLPSGEMETLILSWRSPSFFAQSFQAVHSPSPSFTSTSSRLFSDELLPPLAPPPADARAMPSWSRLIMLVPSTTKHCSLPERRTWICCWTSKESISVAESVEPSSFVASAVSFT